MQFERRLRDYFHGTVDEQKAAYPLIQQIENHYDGNKKRRDIPELLYVTGLKHFLLAIAWDIRDRYKDAFGETIIHRVDNDWNKKKIKVKSIDRRLVPLIDVEKSELGNLLDDPETYIIETVLPETLNCTSQRIKTRLSEETVDIVTRLKRAAKDAHHG